MTSLTSRHRGNIWVIAIAAIVGGVAVACGSSERDPGDAGNTDAPVAASDARPAGDARPVVDGSVDAAGSSVDAAAPSADASPTAADAAPVAIDARPAGAVDARPSSGECEVFPADNPWNTDISAYPVHPSSDTYIASIGASTGMHADFGTVWMDAPIGIPYVNVPGDQPRVAVSFTWPDESDPGPYPIPPDAPIEGGSGAPADSDRHVLVIDVDACVLYELFHAFPEAGGSWSASSGAVFDLSSNELRPDRWTSADAAGLPIYPGLVRYDEVVERGVINHALRFTASRTQSGYINPATHAAGVDDATAPPMGLRVRMKAGYDCTGYSAEVQVICAALKTYGMFVADNGSNWYLSGAPDPRWSDDNLRDLGSIPGSAFEAVDTGPIISY